MNNITQNILKKIKSGEVDMKSRWHFVLKSVFLIGGVVTAALLVVYLVSFVLFALRQSGVGFVPLYGFRGISMFVMGSPWLLVVASASALIALQLLVNKYSFTHRQPLLYSTIGIVFLVLFGSYAMEQAHIHQRIEGFAEDHGVPVLGAMYRDIKEKRPDNIIFGTITTLTETGFILTSDREEALTVRITEKTRKNPGLTPEVGQTMLIFGDRQGDTITALGVRPAPNDFTARRLNKRDGHQNGEVRGTRTGIPAGR